MENMNYEVYPGENHSSGSSIADIFLWGALGLGVGWLVKELLKSETNCGETLDSDIIDADGTEEQPSVMETERDEIQDITTYDDLAQEIERLNIQISALNKEIYKLKGAGRNSNDKFDEDMLKKLAKIVFEQKVIQERLARLRDAAV